MNNYKVAICGAHSQGKTSLVNKLKEYTYLTHDHKFSFRTNLTRDLSRILPINEGASDASQYLVMARHLEFALSTGNWILDRSALDGLAYTAYFFDMEQVSEQIYKSTLLIYKECLKHYDRIFYIKPELPLVDDGTRSINAHFFDGVVGKFNFYINHFTMEDRLTYLTGSIEERAKTVIDTIKKDLENEQ